MAETSMVFGPSSNPLLGTFPLEYSLYVVTWACPSIASSISHISYVVPPLVAIARRSPLVRSREFGRERVFERLRMGANRKDLFYYLVRSRTEFSASSSHDNRVGKTSLKLSAHPPTSLRRMGSWPSSPARTRQAASSRPRSTTSYAIR